MSAMEPSTSWSHQDHLARCEGTVQRLNEHLSASLERRRHALPSQREDGLEEPGRRRD